MRKELSITKGDFMSTKTLPCGKKLAEELRKRGLTQSEASEAIGYCGSYLSSCIATNRISLVAAKALEFEFRITPETYSDVQLEEHTEDTDLKVLGAKINGALQAVNEHYMEISKKLDRIIAEWEGTR